jgi:hypothetical protein
MADDVKPPAATFGDLAHAATKGGIGMIPLVGSPAAEILAFVVGTPLERRQQEWCETVAAAIEELRSRGVDIEKLQADPAFTDAILRATGVAMCTHQKEKLDALRNAILNSGLPRAPEPDLRQLFLGMVDRFTEWHIRLLALFDDPAGWFKTRNIEFPRHLSQTYLDKLAFAAFPALQSQAEFTEQICRDLQQNGLVTRTEMGIVTFMDDASASRTVEFGKKFLKFIRQPPPR